MLNHLKTSHLRKYLFILMTHVKVLLKLSSLHSITVSDHIFAWYKIGTDIIPLGFNYVLQLN